MASTPLVSTKENLDWSLPTTSSFQELQTKPSPNQAGPLNPSDENVVILKSFMAALTIFLSTAGMAMNSVNIYVFVRMGLRESVTVTTLFLAYSDFFFSAAKLGQAFGNIVGLFENSIQVFFFPVDPFVVTTSSNVVVTMYALSTSLITAYLALTRCMCVVRPLRFKSVFTVRRTVIVLVIASACPFLLNLPGCVEYRTGIRIHPITNVSRPVLWVTEQFRDRLLAITFFNLFLFPITLEITVVISTILIIAGLKSTSAFRKSGIVAEKDERFRKDTELQGKERRVAYQVILISVTFMIANLSGLITIILIFTVEEFQIGRKQNLLYVILTEFLGIPAMLNCCSSMIIYLKFNSAFRKVLFPKEQ